MPIEHDQDLLRAVGRRLRRLRDERQISQAHLAEHLDVEVATLSRYERGERPIHLSMLARAASVLDVQLVAFFTDEMVEDLASDDIRHEAAKISTWRLLDEHHRDLAMRVLKEFAAVGRAAKQGE